LFSIFSALYPATVHAASRRIAMIIVLYE
jgi:hypothetical protein